MTQPSKVLEAIVSTLRASLGDNVAEVRQIAGAFGQDLAELQTIATPGVYVAMTRMPLAARDYDPAGVDARFIAVCAARDPNPLAGQLTRDDVAMDLAAVVLSVVATSRWPDADLEPTCNSQASQVAAVNAFVPELVRRGLSVWRVEWSQGFDVTPRDVEATLVALREIRMVAVVPGVDTPDVAATANFEGG